MVGEARLEEIVVRPLPTPTYLEESYKSSVSTVQNILKELSEYQRFIKVYYKLLRSLKESSKRKIIKNVLKYTAIVGSLELLKMLLIKEIDIGKILELIPIISAGAVLEYFVTKKEMRDIIIVNITDEVIDLIEKYIQIMERVKNIPEYVRKKTGIEKYVTKIKKALRNTLELYLELIRRQKLCEDLAEVHSYITWALEELAS